MPGARCSTSRPRAAPCSAPASNLVGSLLVRLVVFVDQHMMAWLSRTAQQRSVSAYKAGRRWDPFIGIGRTVPRLA